MQEARHFGMDAEIQRPRMANFGLLNCPNEALIQASSYRPWPGYRHPCRYDGIFAGSQRPRWEPGFGSSASQIRKTVATNKPTTVIISGQRNKPILGTQP